MPGYTGMNCTFKCPYPSYGRKCQRVCYCDSNQCDVSRGCNSLTSGNAYLTISSYHYVIHFYDISKH